MEPLSWRGDAGTLWCPLNVHPGWLETARDHAQHRLRQARSRRAGLLYPDDVTVSDDRIEIRIPSPRAHTPVSHTWDDAVFPALEALAFCHRQGVTGFAPRRPVGGRWVPPVSWFLPPASDARSDMARRADLRFVRSWLVEDFGPRISLRGAPQAPSLLDALGSDDPADFLRFVAAERAEATRAFRDRPRAPSFLALLTEAELLERVATVYRFRQREGHGADAPDGRWPCVLELETAWKDPHFPALTRPSPQELWDTLTEESRTTPVLALSRSVPNPLDARLDAAVGARWVGVHDDQPLVYVMPRGEPIPRRGFMRLHLIGDNVLMARKRAFTSFAGGHPALDQMPDHASSTAPFTENPQRRDALESAILATRGVFAVQGPPGTGKTHLATEVVRHFLRANPSGRVLVCAKEHFALDHILRKITAALAESSILFRAWRSVSLAKQRRAPDAVDGAWLASTVTRALAEKRWSPESAGWSAYQASTADQHDRRLASLARQSANLVFCTTMDALMVDFLDQESFDLVVVEEAGKCYPSELLHALCFGRTALMIGDQRQLPPYQERRTRDGVAAWQDALRRARESDRERRAMADRFGEVFRALEALDREGAPLSEGHLGWLRPFEFLFDRLPTRHRLEEQFRMEAPLSRVVGSIFYGRPFQHRKHELVERGALRARPLGDLVPPDLDVPLLWIDTPHMTVAPEATEDAQKRGVRDNQFEHDVVLRYLRRLRPSGRVDLVILTPYNAQKRLLLDSDALRSVCAALTDTPWEQVVRTVDEYQGREAELVVLSLVRNNSLGARAWGFMLEPERLNVMFSRARFRLVVVGSSAHIERHAEEASWLHRVWRAYRREADDPRNARILRPEELAGG